MVEKLKILAFLISILLLLIIGGSFLSPLDEMRSEYKLTAALPLENAPPELVLATTVLGGLRGIIVDMLWLRAQKMLGEGNYFELRQLYDWIGQLQPHLEEVWSYNAWNMAYNISVKLPEPEERWRWIKRGMALLRERALKYNPFSAKLRWDLAWIYYHKIGGWTDNFNWYYKQRLAREMEDILGEKPDLDLLASLPQSLEEIGKRYPEVRALIDRLKEKSKWKGLNDFSLILEPGRYGGVLDQEVRKKSDKKAFQTLTSILRARYLKKVLKMDPLYMKELMDDYGPLDWRTPEACSLYWATLARKYAPEGKSLRYDRLIYFSLQGIYRRGRLVSYTTKEGNKLYIQSPDWRFLDRMEKLFESVLKTPEGKGGPGISSSHAAFLQEAVMILYGYNKLEEAEKYFRILKEKYPADAQQDSVEGFVIAQMGKDIEGGNRYRVREVIYTILNQALWNLSLGDDNRAAGLERLAKLVWDTYQEKFGTNQRLSLPPFDKIRKDAVEHSLKVFPPALSKNLRQRLGIE